MSTFAASVTIVDLPAGTTVSGAELFEAVQTTSGVGQSVQLSLTQMAGLPALNSFVKTVGTSLATTGTATSIVAFVANNGISSAQLASSSVGSTSIAATGVVRANLTALAVGSAQLDVAAIQRTNITGLAVGSAQLDVGAVISTNIGAFAVNAAQINTATIGTAQMVAGALGMTLLNTLAPNGVASTNDTSSFGSSFHNYMIMFENVCPASQTTTLQITLATSGSAFTTAGYVSVAQVDVNSTLVTDTSTAVLLLSGTRVTTQLQTATTFGLSGFVKFFNPASAVNNKPMVGQVMYPTPGAVGTGTVAIANVNGVYQNASPVTGINFAFNSGNIATGVIRIYGLS